MLARKSFCPFELRNANVDRWPIHRRTSQHRGAGISLMDASSIFVLHPQTLSKRHLHLQIRSLCFRCSFNNILIGQMILTRSSCHTAEDSPSEAALLKAISSAFSNRCCLNTSSTSRNNGGKLIAGCYCYFATSPSNEKDLGNTYSTSSNSQRRRLSGTGRTFPYYTEMV